MVAILKEKDSRLLRPMVCITPKDPRATHSPAPLSGRDLARASGNHRVVTGGTTEIVGKRSKGFVLNCEGHQKKKAERPNVAGFSIMVSM